MTTASRLGSLLLATTLVVSACSGSDDTSPSQEITDDSTASPDAEPRWTQVEVAEDALPAAPTPSINASLAAAGKQPMLFAGTLAEPGQPGQATVWSGRKGLGTAQALDVGGTHSWVADLAAADGTSLVVGGIWQDGTASPFALSSTDRRTWEAIEVPEEATERALPFTAVALGNDATPYVADHVAVVANLSTGDLVELPGATCPTGGVRARASPSAPTAPRSGWSAPVTAPGRSAG